MVMLCSSFTGCVGRPEYHLVRGILCRCEANKLEARRARVWNLSGKARPTPADMGKTGRQEASHDEPRFTLEIISRQNTGGTPERMQHTPHSLFPLQSAKVHLGPAVLPTRDTGRRSVLRNAAPQLSSAPALSFLPNSTPVIHHHSHHNTSAHASHRQRASHPYLHHPPTASIPSPKSHHHFGATRRDPPLHVAKYAHPRTHLDSRQR